MRHQFCTLVLQNCLHVIGSIVTRVTVSIDSLIGAVHCLSLYRLVKLRSYQSKFCWHKVYLCVESCRSVEIEALKREVAQFKSKLSTEGIIKCLCV